MISRAAKAAAIKRAFAAPKYANGAQVYPGFLSDSGIGLTGSVPGLLSHGRNGLFGPYSTASSIDVDKQTLVGLGCH